MSRWGKVAPGARIHDADTAASLGLCALFLFDEDSGQVRDLVSGTNTPLTSGGVARGERGRILTFNGSQQVNMLRYLPTNVGANSFRAHAANFSVLGRIRPDAAAATDPAGIFGIYASGDQSGFGIGWNTSSAVGMQWLSGNGAGTLSRSSGTNGVWYDVYAHVDRLTAGFAWINGQPATTSQGATLDGGGGSQNNEISLGAQHRSAGFLRNANGAIEWGAVLFGPSLNDTSAFNLYQSDFPYNLLTPRRRYYLVPAAGGGIQSGAGTAALSFAASGVGDAVYLRRARPWAWDNAYLSFQGATLLPQQPQDIAQGISYEVFFEKDQAGTAVGASSFAFSAAGVGASTSAGTGAVTFTFTPAGVGASTFAAPGSTSFAFTAAAVGDTAGSVASGAGASAFAFTPDGVGAATGAGAGATLFAFAPAAVGASTWAGVGATSFAFAPAAVGASSFAGAGSSAFSFAGAGVGDTAGSVSSGAGASSFAFSPAAVGASTWAGAGASAFAFSPTGVGASTSAAVGSVTFSFAAPGVGGTAGSVVSGAGASSFAFAGAGAGASTVAAVGSVTFSFAAGGVGASVGVVSAVGAASFSFSAAAASPVTEGVGYYLRLPVKLREPTVVPEPAIAPGVHFRVSALLLTSGAWAQGAAAGFDALIVGLMNCGSAKGAAQVPSSASAPRASLQAGAARVDLRLSMDEVAALLVATL